eukprot:11741-Eustigmatos_ZCMA.PRE.1
MAGGSIPVLILASATNNNRYISFTDATGTALASIQSWYNSTASSDLRFFCNGNTERMRINTS